MITLLSMKSLKTALKIAISTPHQTRFVSINTGQSVNAAEDTVLVYCENHRKPTNTPCRIKQTRQAMYA
jgi:hypothetical protein